jgi:RNA polymerase sigma-70 factor (ECF subfamily)
MQETLATNAHDDAEARLIDEAKRRTPSAWAEIYDRYHHRLFKYCYFRTANETIAADLASRVFLEALEGIDRYVYRGRSLLAWLYRIARNLVSDHHRSREREAAAMEQQASVLAEPSASEFAQVVDRQDLVVAIRQLTEHQQQVVVLRFFCDYTTAEIAASMEKTERAVYSLEVRALATLRRLLTDGLERRAA